MYSYMTYMCVYIYIYMYHICLAPANRLRLVLRQDEQPRGSLQQMLSAQ